MVKLSVELTDDEYMVLKTLTTLVDGKYSPMRINTSDKIYPVIETLFWKKGLLEVNVETMELRWVYASKAARWLMKEENSEQ